MNKAWPSDFQGKFDLVHQRLALAAAGPAQADAVHNLGALVKPGGWIQLIEASNSIPADSGPALRHFVTAVGGVYAAFKSPFHIGKELASYVGEAGFEDVHDRVIDVKLGAANPDAELAKQGVLSTTFAARNVAGFAKSEYAVFCPLNGSHAYRRGSVFWC